MAVVVADSAERADVITAITAASSGDTVRIPADTATWSTAVTIPSDKNLLIEGAGTDATVITAETVGSTFLFGTSGSRMTKMGWILSSTSTDGMIYVRGQNWRIDHCSFNNASGISRVAILCQTNTTDSPNLHPVGLIDHNTFTNGRIVVFGYYKDSPINPRWNEELGLGTNNAVFVEDNTFTCNYTDRNCIDANYGGRYVFRHNSVTDQYIECHSVSGTLRGTRSWEIYENTITQSGLAVGCPARLRAGTGVVFNNTLVGTFTNLFFGLDNVRSYTAVGDGGLADGSSLWDGNTLPTVTYQGYPARDQIGRSKDDWEWTVENPYPTQALEPAYCWGNIRGEDTVEFDIYNTGARNYIHIVKDRDFYNAVKPGYTPYTYPHPLQGVGVEPGYAGNLIMALR